MSLVFELTDFKGPLDLLLHLIGKAQIDIREIFVSQVTDQYLAMVRDAGLLDMEEASEFINMAATLILIKSRSLLPNLQAEESEEENPEVMLIRQLEEYAKFQQIAQQMHAFEETASRMFSKLPDEFPLPPASLELEGLTLEALVLAFSHMMAKAKDTGQEEGEPAARIIRLDAYTVPQCMANILKKTRKGPIAFHDLFSEHPNKNEVVTLFLALLELIKQGRLMAAQDADGGNISISRRTKESTADEQP